MMLGWFFSRFCKKLKDEDGKENTYHSRVPATFAPWTQCHGSQTQQHNVCPDRVLVGLHNRNDLPKSESIPPCFWQDKLCETSKFLERVKKDHRGLKNYQIPWGLKRRDSLPPDMADLSYVPSSACDPSGYWPSASNQRPQEEVYHPVALSRMPHGSTRQSERKWDIQQAKNGGGSTICLWDFNKGTMKCHDVKPSQMNEWKTTRSCSKEASPKPNRQSWSPHAVTHSSSLVPAFHQFVQTNF